MLPFVLLCGSILGLVFHDVTWYWITLCVVSAIWFLVKLGSGGIDGIGDIGGSFFD